MFGLLVRFVVFVCLLTSFVDLFSPFVGLFTCLLCVFMLPRLFCFWCVISLFG